MPRYRYTATTADGSASSGVLEAADKAAAVRLLRGQDCYPLKITEQREPLELGRVSLPVMAAFCQQLSTILRAGVPLGGALDILCKQTEDRQMKKILGAVYVSALQGRSLTESFAPFRRRLPMLFMSMVEAGEASGTLDDCMGRAAESFTAQNRLNRKVMGALTYPIVLLSLTVVIVAVMLIAVIPQFVTMYDASGVELPSVTQFLISVSNFVGKQWLVLLFVLGMMAVAVRLWLSSDKGRLAWDGFKLRLPVAGKLLLKICTARYARTLALLSSAGLDLPHCLEVAGRAAQNRAIERKLEAVRQAVENGESLAAALERIDFLPPMVVHMTRLGEESGSLEELLEKTARFYEEESEAAMQQMTALLEPLIIVIMGGVILVILLGVMLPVFNIGNLM